MSRGLLMAILVATLVIPMRAAGDPKPARGLRRTVLQFAAFVAVWTYSLLHLFPLLKD
jgi:hypothetical protein